MKQLALIGPTASGKTALSLALARELNACILSLDSLSIYREIDIASAKPSLQERAGIPHFGIDLLSPEENFDVTTYIDLYQKVRTEAEQQGRGLIIVGGTSFYLKMLLEGISEIPPLSPRSQEELQKLLADLPAAHAMLSRIDPKSMAGIETADRYRIEKMLGIYLETGISPSVYFAAHPPRAVIHAPLPIYEITMERSLLRKRIALRTEKMLSDGLIDEVVELEKKYGRSPQSMRAIGIRETLAFLDGTYDRTALAEKITINTGRLAKRQETFNRSQFTQTVKGSAGALLATILSQGYL